MRVTVDDSVAVLRDRHRLQCRTPAHAYRNNPNPKQTHVQFQSTGARRSRITLQSVPLYLVEQVVHFCGLCLHPFSIHQSSKENKLPASACPRFWTSLPSLFHIAALSAIEAIWFLVVGF